MHGPRRGGQRGPAAPSVGRPARDDSPPRRRLCRARHPARSGPAVRRLGPPSPTQHPGPARCSSGRRSSKRPALAGSRGRPVPGAHRPLHPSATPSTHPGTQIPHVPLLSSYVLALSACLSRGCSVMTWCFLAPLSQALSAPAVRALSPEVQLQGLVMAAVREALGATSGAEGWSLQADAPLMSAGKGEREAVAQQR